MTIVASGSVTISDVSDGIVSRSTPPANPSVGLTYLDSSVTPAVLKKWSGYDWVPASLSLYNSDSGAYGLINQANSAANSANSTANNAYGTATQANDLANQANGTAIQANSTANAANSTANSAYGTASQAHDRANEAYGTANQANDTANSANGTAIQANSTANSAKGTANQALQSANDAIDTLGHMADDNYLTPQEKVNMKRQMSIINGEKSMIDDQANIFGVNRSGYDTAWQALTTFISPYISNLTTTSTVDGTTLNTNFTNYYNARTNLLKSVSNASRVHAQDVADAAKAQAEDYTDNALQGQVVGGYNSLEDTKDFTTWTDVLPSGTTGLHVVNRGKIDQSLGDFSVIEIKVSSGNGGSGFKQPNSNLYGQKGQAVVFSCYARYSGSSTGNYVSTKDRIYPYFQFDINGSLHKVPMIPKEGTSHLDSRWRIFYAIDYANTGYTSDRKFNTFPVFTVYKANGAYTTPAYYGQFAATKLEYGTIATQWQPSESEYDDQLQIMQDDVSNLKQFKSFNQVLGTWGGKTYPSMPTNWNHSGDLIIDSNAVARFIAPDNNAYPVRISSDSINGPIHTYQITGSWNDMTINNKLNVNNMNFNGWHTLKFYDLQDFEITDVNDNPTGITASHIRNSAQLDLGVDVSGNFVRSHDVYNRTYSGAANAYINSDGTLGRSTSATKYKENIETVPTENYAENILSLEPKSWHDKAQDEALAKAIEEGNQVDGIPYMQRYYGLIAEDVEKAGLSEFVSYGEPDKDGKREVEGIEYSRLWVLLIPIIKKLKEQVSELKLDNEKVNKELIELKSSINSNK